MPSRGTQQKIIQTPAENAGERRVDLELAAQLPGLRDVLTPMVLGDDPIKQRNGLLAITFSDAYRPVAEFLSTDELRELARLVGLRGKLAEHCALDDPSGTRRRDRPMRSVAERCERMERIGEIASWYFTQAPSVLSYALLFEVREFIYHERIGISVCSTNGPRERLRLAELSQGMSALVKRLDTLVHGPGARDYIINAIAIAPAKVCKEHLCESFRLEHMLGQFVQTFDSRALTAADLRSFRRYMEFGLHLAGIGEIDLPEDVHDQKPTGLGRGYTIIERLFRDRDDEEKILSDPNTRAVLLPLLMKMRDECITESSIDLSTASSRYSRALEIRARLVATAFPDEIESIRQEAFATGLPWGVFKAMAHGNGWRTPSAETAKLAGRALVTVAEYFHSAACAKREGAELEDSFNRQLGTVAHSGGWNEPLYDVYRALRGCFLGGTPHHQLVAREFLRHATPAGLRVWQGILNRELTGAQWITDAPNRGIPLSDVVQYVTATTAIDASPVLGTLYDKYSDTECAKLVALAAADPAALRALAEISPENEILWDRLLSAGEINSAESLRALVKNVAHRYLANLDHNIRDCQTEMSRLLEGPSLEIKPARYCRERVNSFLTRFHEGFEEFLEGRLELDCERLPQILRQRRFAELNAGLFDLRAALPASEPENYFIADPRHLLHDLFPRGLFAPNEPLSGEPPEASLLRARIRDGLAATAGPLVACGNLPGELFFGAMLNDPEERERFIGLLYHPVYSAGALSQLLEVNGHPIPATTFEILPKSAVRSWSSLELSDDRTAALQIVHDGGERSACSLALSPDGTLCITATSLPQPIKRDGQRFRGALTDFMQRYCTGEINTTVPRSGAAPFFEGIHRVTVYEYTSGFEVDDLPKIEKTDPKLPAQRLLWSR